MVFENDRIKLWELFLEPGEEVSLHTHTNDYYFYVIEGSVLEIFNVNGDCVAKAEPKTGDVLGFKVEGDQLIDESGQLDSVPATHWARNAGKQTYREILIELKPVGGKSGGETVTEANNSPS